MKVALPRVRFGDWTQSNCQERTMAKKAAAKKPAAKPVAKKAAAKKKK
jgi:hypothetical protein